jgi:hypothetical protein
VIARSAGLLVLGLFQANAGNVSTRYTHISQKWWTVLGQVSGERKAADAGSYPALPGLGILLALFIVCRRFTPEGQVAMVGLDFLAGLLESFRSGTLGQGSGAFKKKFGWMVTAAAMLFAALLLYRIADVKGWRGWAKFSKAAGENRCWCTFCRSFRCCWCVAQIYYLRHRRIVGPCVSRCCSPHLYWRSHNCCCALRLPYVFNCRQNAVTYFGRALPPVTVKHASLPVLASAITIEPAFLLCGRGGTGRRTSLRGWR